MDTARSPRRRRHIVLLLLTIALLNLPAIAVATHVFTDVPDNATHAAGIHYIADAGITAGCTPTEYCPADSLTRAQMGTFLHRASGNSATTPPSVNAATLSADAVQTVSSQNTVDDATFNSHSVACPEGTVVVGGGGFTSSGAWKLEDSRPLGEDRWQVFYRILEGQGDQTATVYARCLRIGQ
jgi:hypothetical protein